MTEGIRTLYVGVNPDGYVSIQFQGIITDDRGRCWLDFSPREARDLAALLIAKANEVEKVKCL